MPVASLHQHSGRRVADSHLCATGRNTRVTCDNCVALWEDATESGLVAGMERVSPQSDEYVVYYDVMRAVYESDQYYRLAAVVERWTSLGYHAERYEYRVAEDNAVIVEWMWPPDKITISDLGHAVYSVDQ